MKILLIDDHELVRYGIGKMLEDVVRDAQVLEAASLHRGSAIYGARQAEIQLVVLDLNLPDARGLAGLRQFIRRHPHAPVVVLSGSVDEAIAAEATAIGAMAFLHKTTDVSELRRRLADLVGSLSAARSPAPQAAPRAGVRPLGRREMSLNERDLKVLDLLLQGNNNQEIAEALGIAIGTTKNYISGLLAAFGVTSRARLMALFN